MTSCQSDALVVGNGNDVEVRLDVQQQSDIQEIVFTSGAESVIVEKHDIKNMNFVLFQFSCRSEGLYKVCVNRAVDTVCFESYVEKGCRPKLLYSSEEIIVESWY